MLHRGSIKMAGHKFIWKTWAPLQVKIFLWLAPKRRYWTADRRAKKPETTAIYVIKARKRSTISLHHAPSPERYGTMSCMPSDVLYLRPR